MCITSMYFSGIGNVSAFGTWLNSRFTVMTIDEVTLNRPEVFPGFSVIFWFSRLRPVQPALKFSTEIFTPYRLFPPWSGFSEFVVSSEQISCTICHWEFLKMSTPFVASTLLLHWVFEDGFLTRPFLNVCDLRLSFPNSPRDERISEEYSRWNFLSKLVKSGLVSCRNRTILKHCSKRNVWTFRWFSESLFIRSFPICQEVLNISQIATAFHRVRPPCFFQAWLQQYGRRSFLLFCVPLSNTIRLGSMGCRSSMIPWWIFTGFAKFQGFVSVNDFRLFWRLEKLSFTLFRLLGSFGFARIRLNPLSGKILYHDCVSVTVSRFTFLVEDFVISCYQVTKLFCTKYDSAKKSSARRPCDLGPLADFAISVFREVSINTVLTQHRTSRGL